jgi:2-polyprenyl-6-methoxyphenol hydroxylase-like FAD-dependent oxidoreductase
VCMALISRDQHLRLDQALAGFPDVMARLNGAAPVTIERGAVTATRRLKAVHRGHVALTGDASGSVDAITGEGICLGFQQALALAEALANEDLAQYEAEHKRILRLPTFMARTNAVNGEPQSPAPASTGNAVLSPRIFAGMLAMHVGAASHIEFAANGIELSLRMLAP